MDPEVKFREKYEKEVKSNKSFILWSSIVIVVMFIFFLFIFGFNATDFNSMNFNNDTSVLSLDTTSSMASFNWALLGITIAFIVLIIILFVVYVKKV